MKLSEPLLAPPKAGIRLRHPRTIAAPDFIRSAPAPAVISLMLFLAAFAPGAWGQTPERDPHIGYLYPAGGRQGSVFQVAVGGQSLRGATGAHISGDGVKASVVGYVNAFRPLNKEQLLEFETYLNQRLKGVAPAAGVKLPIPGPIAKVFSARATGDTTGTKPAGQAPSDHPLIREMDKLTTPALEFAAKEVLKPRKAQTNAQIGETVLLEITVAPDAAPGDHEVRLTTPIGLTNPLCFQIGQLPETCEPEQRNRTLSGTLESSLRLLRQRAPGADNKAGRPREPAPPAANDTPIVGLPVIINGQIMPGQVDHFRFKGSAGTEAPCPGGSPQTDPLPRRRRPRVVPGRPDDSRQQGKGPGLRGSLSFSTPTPSSCLRSPKTTSTDWRSATHFIAVAKISCTESPLASFPSSRGSTPSEAGQGPQQARTCPTGIGLGSGSTSTRGRGDDHIRQAWWAAHAVAFQQHPLRRGTRCPRYSRGEPKRHGNQSPSRHATADSQRPH